MLHQFQKENLPGTKPLPNASKTYNRLIQQLSYMQQQYN